MRDKPLHPTKPVRIKHITDDIRDLRSSVTKQQEILLSGRALADMLAGDAFDIDREADKQFFSKANAGKVDLNTVTTACIRYLPLASFINGPLSVQLSGHLYVASVLPNGSLVWSGGKNGEREGNPTTVRQIIYGDNVDDITSYTRVGKYNAEANDWKWSNWENLSGALLRVKVTNDVRDVLLKTENLRYGVIYELYCGGATINLPSADKFAPATRIVFEQHANTTPTYVAVDTDQVKEPAKNVQYFIKNADGDFVPAGETGYITEFGEDAYYTQVPAAEWFNTVEYTEYAYNAKHEAVQRQYSTQLTPPLSTARVSSDNLENGEWALNTEAATQYVFEVIDRESSVIGVNGVESTRTWMIDVDAEAISQVAGMAELLDAHTDLAIPDIVQYSLRKFRNSLDEDGKTEKNDGNITAADNENYRAFVPRNNSPLIVTRSATMPGFIKFTMELNSNPVLSDGETADLTNGFGVTIYKYNENSPMSGTVPTFNFAVTTDTTPNMYKKYYLEDGRGGFVLAGDAGYVASAFEAGVAYYEKTITISSDMEPAKFTYLFGDDINETKEYKAEFFKTGDDSFDRDGLYFKSKNVLVGFIKAHRNDTICVVINSDNHVHDMKLVSPAVEFYPDPHDSYINKCQVNTQAFTLAGIARLTKPGPDEEMIPSAKLLAKAYEEIVKNLQGKGLMWGRKFEANLNTCVKTGTYTVYPDEDNNAPVTAEAAATLIVNNTSFASEDKLFTADSHAISAGTTVTQILLSAFSAYGAPAIYYRIGTGTDVVGGTVTWTDWVCLSGDSKIINVSSEVITSNGNVLSGDIVSNWLKHSSPTVVLNGNGGTVEVKLPDVATYKNCKFQLEAINTAVIISFEKDGDTYKYTNDTKIAAPNRMIYPVECDGEYWYVVTAS